jgi:hypothetical protein
MTSRAAVLRALAFLGGVACLGLAAHRLDLGVGEVLRALAIAGLAVLPLGDLLTRGCPVRSRGERLALAAVVGYPATGALVYAVAVLGVPWLYPVLVLAAALGVLFRRRAPIPGDAVSGLGPALLVLGFSVLMLTGERRAFERVPGGVAYRHPVDDPLHLAMYAEMLRGVPPREMPTVAGVQFPHYHVLGYQLGVALARYGGLSVIALHHGLVPVAHLALFAAAVWLAVRARTGDRNRAAAALVAAFLVSGALERVFWRRLVTGAVPLEFFQRSVSGGAGFAIWAGVFALLALHDRERRAGSAAGAQAFLWLSGGLAGLSYLFKAQAFGLFGAAWGAALLLRAWRDRDRTALGPIALAVALAVLAAVSWRTQTAVGGLAWVPGLFAREHVLPALKADPTPLLGQGLSGALQALPQPARELAATALGLWRVLNLSLLVPAFACVVLRRWRSAGLADLGLALLLPLGFVLVFGVGATDAHAEGSAQFLREALYGFPLLAAVLEVCLLAALLDRGGLRGGRVVLAGVVAGALLLTPAWSLPRAQVGPTWVLWLSDDERRALDWIRENTPREAVVLSARSLSFPDLALRLSGWDRHAVVAGLAGRRAVAEYFGASLERVDPVHDRARDLRRFFATSEERVALRILDRYRVDYVIEYAGLPIRFPRTRLAVGFASPRVTVYRVLRGPGA